MRHSVDAIFGNTDELGKKNKKLLRHIDIKKTIKSWLLALGMEGDV